MASEEIKRKSNFLSREILSAAIHVHKILGPGLLESDLKNVFAMS
jgi:hypothetical protein